MLLFLAPSKQDVGDVPVKVIYNINFLVSGAFIYHMYTIFSGMWIIRGELFNHNITLEIFILKNIYNLTLLVFSLYYY